MKIGAPTTYKRITPKNGCGFILKRIYDLTYDNQCGDPVTKKEVYAGSKWEGREKHGFASLLWSALLKDGLICSVDGMAEYEPYHGFRYMNGRNLFYKKLRAKGHIEKGKYTVRYHISANGMGVLFDMMARVNKIREEKKTFCERNGIEFGTGKTLNTVGSVAEYDAKKDEERNFKIKQKLDVIINDLMDLRDSLS